MTTIVYDHKAKQIAIDSRYTANGTISADNGKKFTVLDDESVFFFAGKKADYPNLVRFFTGELGSNHEWIPECGAFMVKDGAVYECAVTKEGEPWKDDMTDSSWSTGSGGKFALAALDFGKSAKEAVEYAMTRDCYTGGKVRVFDVEKMEFIEE